MAFDQLGLSLKPGSGLWLQMGNGFDPRQNQVLYPPPLFNRQCNAFGQKTYERKRTRPVGFRGT